MPILFTTVIVPAPAHPRPAHPKLADTVTGQLIHLTTHAILFNGANEINSSGQFQFITGI